ncbi:hypothetical protein Tco_0154601 [Tanacetum coccineum]
MNVLLLHLNEKKEIRSLETRSKNLRITKVVKGEFEKLEDLNDEDVSLTCDTTLEVFNKEFNWMSRMDDDLFTYKVEVANIPCDLNKDDDSEKRVSHEADDDMGYDPSDVAFTEWPSKNLTIFCKSIQTYLLRTLRDSRLMKNKRMIGSMNGTEMYHGLMRNHGLTLDWKNDGYCNGGNLPGAYIVGNSLHYQDYECDDESCNDGWRRWESHEITYHDHDKIEYENETHDERQKLCETHELSVCNMRRFEMIKCSFGQDEEYVAVIEDECDDLARTSDDACRAYQEIFRMLDEGWMYLDSWKRTRNRQVGEYYKSGGVTVNIPPPPYLALAGLGTVVVVLVTLPPPPPPSPHHRDHHHLTPLPYITPTPPEPPIPPLLPPHRRTTATILITSSSSLSPCHLRHHHHRDASTPLIIATTAAPQQVRLESGQQQGIVFGLIMAARLRLA